MGKKLMTFTVLLMFLLFGCGQKEIRDDQVYLIQTETESVASGEEINIEGSVRFQAYEAISFEYMDGTGKMVKTITPQSDFQFDENGVLKNGAIYMSYSMQAKGKDGKYTSVVKKEAVMIGSENDLNVTNYISTIYIKILI